MNQTASGCEVAGRPAQPQAGSRVMRFSPDFRWQGATSEAYKAPADHWCGIARTVLVGDRGESTAFQVRYFEIAPGGFSSLESHAHEHAVFVLRGAGKVRLGEREEAIHYGDVIYIAPHEIHQLRNDGLEPFGFLCMVDAQRDRPDVKATSQRS